MDTNGHGDVIGTREWVVRDDDEVGLVIATERTFSDGWVEITNRVEVAPASA